jgi:peptidoglycan glycosyltransferase
VNGQIKRVASVALGLLVALVVATTYWQTWARPALAERQDNEIQRVAQFEIRRGVIVTPSRVVARNRARTVKGKTFYFRRYPQGKLAAHVVGYSTAARSRTGLERSLNDYLTGSVRSLSSLVDQSLDKLNGRPIVGDSLRLTLDLNGQQTALEALGDNCGAVVALDPRTGRLRVMASSPSYDPNQVENDFSKIEQIRANCLPASPLLNRASQGLYPPGSTFKVVTASAALESGAFEPASTFYDPGYCTVYGKRVNNFDTSRPFGNVTLATALQYSVNSVFCNIGLKLGARRILKQAKAFGFYDRPPLETPESERRASGLYKLEGRELRLYDPKRDPDVDAGRMAFGQERLLVTPLQMAMVAGTIGNGGILMRPYVVERIVAPNGKTRRKTKPERIRRAVSPVTARDVGDMMVRAVQAGTGTAAQVAGLRIGGKTGTAETGVAGRNVTWFIAFAGREGERPELAIAVVLQNQSLTGGATAAPIARQVMQALLQTTANP